MQRQVIQTYCLALAVGLTLSGCFNEPDFADKPEIEFRSIFPYKNLPARPGVGRGRRDSVVISIDFKDGRGDLGNTLPLSKADSALYASNGRWGNYRIQTFRLINRQYVEVEQRVNSSLFFPDLAKGKPPGAIQGTLDFNQTFLYGSSFQLLPTKFRITIRDRQLNESNVVETDTVWVPWPRF
ncbi:hypothetical protein [Spirosoma montaniterrae]|uniref:Uncharacterized protein n=1 Tax=Spirosoma montaniterrae TaxID=1178516 RepID=A0A1P9WRX0_9BACT|nr:hypothetical protein [Spirosoma montaniterrae]AQG78122.1 hypothetical protein AWR27_01395 [Spirosoma montaniterrae]